MKITVDPGIKAAIRLLVKFLIKVLQVIELYLDGPLESDIPF